MSKKNAIISILIAVVIIIGALLWIYFSGSTSTPTPVAETGTSDAPFGNTTADKKNPPTNNGEQGNTGKIDTGTVSTAAIQSLRQIYSLPTSGAMILSKNGINEIRFVDRANGNIYKTKSDSTETIRISNTTVPKVAEAVWANTGESLIMRYLKEGTSEIDSFSAKIKISSSTSNDFIGEITGNFLPINALSVIINPSGTKAFSLFKKTNGNGSYGVISALDGSGKRQIFDSQISEWNISWPKDSMIAFTTKPSYKSAGYVYLLNTDTSSFDRIFGDVAGLTTVLSKDVSSIVYSESLRGSLKLNYFNTKTSDQKNLQISTLADKCVFRHIDKNIIYCAVPKNIQTSSYPDYWYMGLVSFSDNIWKIDVNAGTTNMIYEIGKNETADIDAMDLKISADDKYMVFTNKNDLSLWGLKI